MCSGNYQCVPVFWCVPVFLWTAKNVLYFSENWLFFFFFFFFLNGDYGPNFRCYFEVKLKSCSLKISFRLKKQQFLKPWFCIPTCKNAYFNHFHEQGKDRVATNSNDRNIWKHFWYSHGRQSSHRIYCFTDCLGFHCWRVTFCFIIRTLIGTAAICTDLTSKCQTGLW